MKSQTIEWEKAFANDTSVKGLIYKISNELIQHNTKKPNNLIKKLAEDLHRHFSKENIQMVNKHIKMVNITKIKEIYIKNTMRYYPIPVRMFITKMSTNSKCLGNVEKRKL